MITQRRLKELLHYDPETGVFTWAKATNTSIVIGSEAGYIHYGDRFIGIDGKGHAAHRLALTIEKYT